MSPHMEEDTGPTPGPWTALSTGSKGGRRVCATKPAEGYNGEAEILVAEVFGGVMPDEGSFGPWSQPAGDERASAEKEANAALICAAPRFRDALERIASADLKRCSAGWLRDIAVKALQSHAESFKPLEPTQPSKSP